MAILVILILLIAAFFSSAIVIGWVLSTPGYKGHKSNHFNGKQFINPDHQRAKGFKEVFKWMANRERQPWSYKSWPSQYEIPPTSSEQECRISFVNHSTFLIQVGGINILTDPVWSERVSPFSFAGPKRFHEPGIKFEHLPPIHLILLSHNHYDHMDLPTLRSLHNRHKPIMVAPLGNQAFLEQQGFQVPRELDWWETFEAYPRCMVTATPASHFSGRGFFDRDRSLWSGFMVEVENRKIYYAGDTGYGSFFSTIREDLGVPDVAIIPIGAFKPRWFMRPIHMGPEEAVSAWKDLEQPNALACHFGTFPLADDGPTEPEDLLKQLMENEVGQFEALSPGAYRIY